MNKQLYLIYSWVELSFENLKQYSYFYVITIYIVAAHQYHKYSI